MAIKMESLGPAEDGEAPPHQHEKGLAIASLPDIKWSPFYYATFRGAENFHVVVWLLKGVWFFHM